MPLAREVPWPMPEKEFCNFYHSMDFPDGESVEGHWDLRGRFEQYIGNYPLAGKAVLDLGTAAGFCAFSAEKLGARVTGTDLRHISESDFLPFSEHQYQSGDRASWEVEVEKGWRPIKSAFWYAWHKNNSKVTMSYTPLRDLRYADERFDVVIAGAILEHLADPVGALSICGRLAKEAVIIAFTPVLDTDELLMRPITPMTDPHNEYYTWWALSRGLYRHIFGIMGFEIEVVPSHAYYAANGVEATRETVIARRV